MTKVWMSWIVMVVLCVLCSTVYGADDANEVRGLTAWALGAEGRQEVRVGWRGVLPQIELAVGGLHTDAPDGGVEEWSGRGYLLAHALSADLVARLFKASATLPDGSLYGGLFASYTHDREKEWSGGYVLGGQLEVQPTWYVVTEYEGTVWNATDRNWQIVAGVCHVFR